MNRYSTLYDILEWPLRPSFLIIPGIFLALGFVFLWLAWKAYRKRSFSAVTMSFLGIGFIGLISFMGIEVVIDFREGKELALAARAAQTNRFVEGPIHIADRTKEKGKDDFISQNSTTFIVQGDTFEVVHNSADNVDFSEVSIEEDKLIDGRHVRVEYVAVGNEKRLLLIQADMNTPTAETLQQMEAAAAAKAQREWERSELPNHLRDSVRKALFGQMRVSQLDSVILGKLPEVELRVQSIADSLLRIYREKKAGE